MAKTTVDSYTVFGVGDILLGRYSEYGVKILKQVYINAIGEYRWLLQEVRVRDNDATVTGGGTILSLASTSSLTEYDHKWTKDVPKIQKGDVLKDASGKVYIAETEKKVYSVDSGTWTSLDPVTMKWGYDSNSPVLTIQKRAGGQPFSSLFRD